MKLCVVQTRPIKGDIESNILKHQELISLASENGAELIFFPELSLTGYEPTLAETLATTQNDSRLDIFQEISDAKNTIIGVGIPTKQNTGICISMVIFQPQTPRQTYSKQLLHSDEHTYFISSNTQVFITKNTHKIAPAICFESLQIEHSTSSSKNGANIYFASVAKSEKGIEKAYKHYPEIAKRFNMTVLMSNCMGKSDDFISVGNSAIWNNEGILVTQLNETDEGIIVFDTETQETNAIIYTKIGQVSSKFGTIVNLYKMIPRIEILAEKKMIGKRLIMSLSNNKTGELWRSFMPRRREIQNNIGTKVYSLQVFDHSYYENFNPNTDFEKWALIEVSDFESVPNEMATFLLQGGLYAVFSYKGLNTDNSIFQYIFTNWLPDSVYLLDNRPHFEVLGEKYKNNDPNSEEEIWIPIKLKK